MVLLSFTAPTRALSENESRRLHWATRKRRLQDWATLTQVAWKHAENKESLIGQRIRVHVTLPLVRAKSADPHNYVGTNVKCIVDALVRAGMTQDDTTEYVQVVEPRLVADKLNEVLILLTPLGPIQTATEEKL
jgi:hypothetical protein